MTLNKNKISYETDLVKILQDDISALDQQIADRKSEGEDIYNEMRDKISHQEDHTIDSSEKISLFNNDHIPEEQRRIEEFESEIKQMLTYNNRSERNQFMVA